MSLNFNCLNRSTNLKLFPNKSSNNFHSIYRSNDETFVSKFSSLITNSTFSSLDFQLFLKNCQINGWKLPTKFISSIIIYSSLTILLFLTCSIIFYLISYSNIKKFQSSKYRFKTISVLLLIILYIILLIQMIFLIQNLNKSKISFDKSIEEMNKEFNSRTLSKHLKDFLKSFNNFSSNSILLDHSNLLMIKTVEKLLNNYYFLDEINIFLKKINKYFNRILQNEYLKHSFNQFIFSYRNILNDFTNLNKKVCFFFDQNHLEIEEKLFSLFNLIEKQFQYFLQILEKEFFAKFNFNFLNQNQQEQIQSTISLITTLIVLNLTFITIIPVVFLILITINYFYSHFYYQNNQLTIQILFFTKIFLRFFHRNNPIFHHLDVTELQSSHNQQRYLTNTFKDIHPNQSGRKCRSRKAKNLSRNRKNKSCYSYHFYLNPIRIAFGFVTIFLIILCVLSGLFYGIDLFLQGSCRLVHYDQSFLISFAADNFIKSFDDFDVNKTLHNLINDCNKKIHFSKKFFDEFSNPLKNELIPFLIDLNENIYQQFLFSIRMINISSELRLISHLANFARLTDIFNLINHIQKEFDHIELIFKRIIEENSQLSNDFLTETLNEFELFLKQVIESTIDACPLPMNNILKLDRLICHETAFLINGLWLRIFFFMFAVVFFLCIFGIFIYKKLN